MRTYMVIMGAALGLIGYGLMPSHSTGPGSHTPAIVQCVPDCSVHAYMAHLEAGVQAKAKHYTCKPVHAHTVPSSLVVRQAYGHDTLTLRRVSFTKGWNINHDNKAFNDIIVVSVCA